MSYVLEEKSKKFSVIEDKPDSGGKLTILETLNKEDARTLYRHLKKGGSFNNWTPAFFIPSKEKVKIV